MRRLLPIAFLLLLFAVDVAAKHWRGIVPLRSTRKDVEALLGPPLNNRFYSPNSIRSNYSLDEGQVYIAFADEELLRRHYCPTVSIGTVLFIQVMPNNRMLVSNLNLDEKIFSKFDPADPPNSGYEEFIDKKDGLSILAFNGEVKELNYFASASEQPRCSILFENLERVRIIIDSFPRKFDEYGDLSFSDEKKRLDSFAMQLQNEVTSEGYIIVYAGRKAKIAEAQTRVHRIRNYLIRVRKIKTEKVKAVDGGYREEVTIELYIVGAGAKPPSPTLTIDPSKVQIINGRGRRPQEN